eukprot:TRINITY_DN3240_c0_g1_i3.p1 TRINITY_DN3240_c0_g1~~TRINITY_DN3240_c0_g1_i3.p1  ORF type:complete len:286 (+),score=58.18 TRINITY_DN3240_c0_g1_i3:530-1387(+)
MRLLDKRFPALRQVIHLSKKDVPGLLHFIEFPVKSPDTLYKYGNDPSQKNTLIFYHDKSELVRFSTQQILNVGYFVGLKAGINEEDIICHTVPLHLTTGLALAVGMTLSHKAQMVLPSELWSAPHAATALSHEYCTALVVEAQNLAELLDNVDPAQDLSRLTKLIVVAWPHTLPSVDLIQRATIVLKVDSVVVALGSSRTAGIISCTGINEIQTGNVGKPLPNSKISITRNEVVLKKGEEGDIVLEGFNVAEEIGSVQLTGIKGILNENDNLIIREHPELHEIHY